MMIPRMLVQVITAVVVVVFAVGIWASGDMPRLGWLRFYSAAVLVGVLVLGAWEYWVWRLPLVQRLTRVPRDVRGTWRGKLESFWEDANGVSPESKTVYLVIRQSAFRVSAVLLTDESRSKSSLAIVCSDGITASLEYMYLNRPDSRVEERSRMHHGSASLDIVGRPATRLRGRYWTDRDSRGELDFAERRPEISDDYAEAESTFRHKK